MRLLIFVSMFAFMAGIISASCSPQIVSLGSHNISLDFGGQNIPVMPVTSAYECCLGVDTNYTKMVDNNTDSSSFAYLFSYDSPRPISDSIKELGQALWGIIAPLNVKGNNCTTYVEVVASFKNGTLNEHIVKTAQL